MNSVDADVGQTPEQMASSPAGAHSYAPEGENLLRVNAGRNRLICITLCTRNRPAMLEKCLRSIAVQEVPEGWSYRVIVVENGETQKSRDLALRTADEIGLSMDYANEPERGIPLVCHL